MKGISHFSIGVALASCFPEAVRAGASGNPLYFVLGGVFGLLPDTLDFKVYRFLYRHHGRVMPDPLDPDPAMIAGAVAKAVNQAWATGEPVRLKLHTIRLGADLWRRYEVMFDGLRRRVGVRIGPAVSTSREAMPGSEPDEPREAFAALACGIRLDYEAVTTVDIFDGPSFLMKRGADGHVTPVFIPWHREWSHSLVLAGVFGLAAAAVGGLTAGLVTAGAYAAHVLADQLGFLGSDLWFPFGARKRTEGLKLIHSDEVFPNLSAVWLSCLVIFWNLYSVLPRPATAFNIITLCVYGAILPLGLYRLVRRFCRGAAPKR